ncbi:phosphate/phosphite/phosphonate ABC transporter substrate-binding protein [bacterium]|nr:phosphate/phosphite/phosphonate ABC transporter substrate-binding protein [bacterium]
MLPHCPSRRRGLPWPAVLLLMILLPGPRASAGETYSFGVVPQFEARRLAEIWGPILAEVSARSGVTLEMAGSARIPVFEKSFQAGEFDFAYMNPYHALVAMESQGYEPLVRDGSRELFGVLVVREDSPYREVADLAGQEIAFPAPNALGASLLMRAELTRRFGLDFRATYAQTHTSSYMNVVLGVSAAAGGVMGTLKRQEPDVRDALRVLYETRRCPPHPVVAHPRVPAEVRAAVRAAFLALNETETGRALLKDVPIGEAVAASGEDYAPLRELHLEEFYVE